MRKKRKKKKRKKRRKKRRISSLHRLHHLKKKVTALHVDLYLQSPRRNLNDN